MKFLADPTLGKLTKWLRILGFDTIYYRGNIDRNFLKKAQREGRIVLTRKKDMASRSFSGRMFIISEDYVQNQIKEIKQKLSLKPDQGKLFSICLKCNKELEEVSREEVREYVPDYVFENYNDFRMCPQCRSVFWPGTHRDNMIEELKRALEI
ncbi:MAG: Mut7-C RNAse domain-containing protein [Thermodesulfobacteriota bacterium]|nr:Mut7-C RNAse domain-containing protein [Thermodesulfobacteriota bacterium]